MTTPTPQQILDTPMPEDNDAGATTVRGYLAALALGAFEDDNFSGKRAFGSSSWRMDLYEALGDAGYIRYTRDEDGYCADFDSELCRKLITAAIGALAGVSQQPADSCCPFDCDTCHNGCGCPQSHE